MTPPRAHHRLGDEGGDRVRSLGLDHLVQALGQAGRELLLALARLGEAVMVRAVRVQDACDRQVERAVHVRQAAEAGRQRR